MDNGFVLQMYTYVFFISIFILAKSVGELGRGIQATGHYDAEDVFIAELVWERFGQPIVFMNVLLTLDCCLDSLALVQRHLVEMAVAISGRVPKSFRSTDSGHIFIILTHLSISMKM